MFKGPNSTYIYISRGIVPYACLSSTLHTMWAPPVISWFINPSNYDYKYHKLQLYIVIGVTFTNLAIVWGPHFVQCLTFLAGWPLGGYPWENTMTQLPLFETFAARSVERSAALMSLDLLQDPPEYILYYIILYDIILYSIILYYNYCVIYIYAPYIVRSIFPS